MIPATKLQQFPADSLNQRWRIAALAAARHCFKLLVRDGHCLSRLLAFDVLGDSLGVNHWTAPHFGFTRSAQPLDAWASLFTKTAEAEHPQPHSLHVSLT